MSDLEELVVVDTTEELSDSNEVCADQSATNRFDSNQLELDDAYFRIQSDEKPNMTGKNSQHKPAKNNLTYENNPFGILLKSKFKVRAEMEDIPGSAEKRCHFSVEGNEISVKFPLRGSDHRVMKRNGARKVIDFIMSLDRVPARLAELMTVPKEEIVAVNPVAKSRSTNYRIVQQGNNSRAVLVKKREDSKQHFLKFREVCAELTQANLVPKIELVTRRDFKNGIKAKVITRLPGLDIKFVSMENTNMLAKLDSVTKALNYAETHGMGSFGVTDTPLNDDTFQSREQSHSYFQQPTMHHYESDPDPIYWNDTTQNHISVHSRLAPRVSHSPLPPSFDESPLVSYPPHSPTNTFQAPDTYQYGSYADSYFDTTPPEIDYPYYPQSSPPPLFQPMYPSMGPLRYMRGARHAPYEWKGPARSRLRVRRGKIASRRGRQPSLS